MKKRRIKYRKISIRVKFFIALVLMFILAIIFDSQMRPLIKAVTASEAQTLSTNVINRVVIDELSRLDINYSDIIDIQKDENGKILAITTDMKKVNSLKSAITLSVQEKFDKIGKQMLKIPIGTFSGTEILNGHGPKISVSISMSGGVSTDFKSEFVSEGINQTRHRLFLAISTDVLAFIPGYPVYAPVNTNIMIAETIIVGEVPAVFAGNIS